MNWLAHILLSEQNIDFQMGNYLADPLKGRAWENASSDLKKGLEVHFIIDSFTDSNILVKKDKIILRQKGGLLKAIVLDITYDYLLTKNWDLFCNISFEEFTNKFYTQANKRLKDLPLKAASEISKIIKYQVLHKYQKIEDLEISFQRLDRRLSKRLLSRDKASSYFESVVKNIDLLEESFLIFFPLLCEEVKKHLNQEKIKHWKV